jgi:hypothetical protein
LTRSLLKNCCKPDAIMNLLAAMTSKEVGIRSG